MYGHSGCIDSTAVRPSAIMQTDHNLTWSYNRYSDCLHTDFFFFFFAKRVISLNCWKHRCKSTCLNCQKYEFASNTNFVDQLWDQCHTAKLPYLIRNPNQKDQRAYPLPFFRMQLCAKENIFIRFFWTVQTFDVWMTSQQSTLDLLSFIYLINGISDRQFQLMFKIWPGAACN